MAKLWTLLGIVLIVVLLSSVTDTLKQWISNFYNILGITNPTMQVVLSLGIIIGLAVLLGVKKLGPLKF